jgi:8-oxo-dGTP diphosphatase
MRTDAVHGVARRRCPACGHVHFPDPKLAVGVATFRAGELLLVRRSMNPGRGRWALPGGYVDAGEDPRATAARETREETGVEVAVGDVVDVFANPPEDGGAVFVLFDATWRSGEPAAGDDADDAGFFARDALPETVFASTAAVIRRWVVGAP